jgi:hypothetical protein
MWRIRQRANFARIAMPVEDRRSQRIGAPFWQRM